MKKFLAIAIIVGACIPTVSFGATAPIYTATTQVESGESFTVQIHIDPQGGSVYTSKVSLTFSPDILKITSFSFADGWMPLSQGGYDSIDNGNGVLIKTAGFPGGLSSDALFGTVTFSAKQSGTAIIAVSDQSSLLDAENNNTLTSNPSLQVAVSTPAPTQQNKENTNTTNEQVPTTENQQTQTTTSQPTANKQNDQNVIAERERGVTVQKPNTATLLLAQVLVVFNPLGLMVLSIMLLGAGLLIGEEKRNKDISPALNRAKKQAKKTWKHISKLVAKAKKIKIKIEH